jgi:predicted alpha/beta-hydrolase family hydrolase
MAASPRPEALVLIVRATDPSSPLLVLGHGAGAGEQHPWMRRVAAGLGGRGVSVATFDFPYIREKRRLPDPGAVLEQAFGTAWREALAAPDGASVQPRAVFAGGKSMGGRISSQAAAERIFDPSPAGLVFFGYPLHPPGKPAMRRDRHLAAVGLPMLFLHGTRDPFGTPEELGVLTSGLPGSTLELIEGGDHSLVAAKRADPAGVSLERALDRAASWIFARS